ncbi:GNAT family N-acetyltransferase [Roseibium album]|uniref:Putative acetyltransferase n=1 Tax=Roseibium album TaxID=311410 RepID=A0A0M6ZHE3_9HYPH|nr:GNAT family N-acetyltransferase [Roseibium album]CTQ61651.1 putative acetyltransferase [Roseibium album]CTQ75592.1 putative acetyltransferase [Roseibium album]CTQ78221.1 putative acetyltransferase [Roseibium album]
MSYHIIDCRELDAGQLCAAMNSAFSDYCVPLSLTVDKFLYFQKQRGFSAEHSFVSMSGSDIAGFWYSTAPSASYGSRGYAVSVGTDPRHRRKGILKNLFKAVVEKQKSDGANGMQLEVISTNERALRAYELFGYKHQRTVRVCRLPKHSLPVSRRNDLRIDALTVEELPDDENDYFDTLPTPQNSRASLTALRGRMNLIGVSENGRLLGWGAANPDGSVAQIAVHRNFRRNGIGSVLLEGLGQSVDTDHLTFVNVDVSATGVNAFLDRAGAEDLLQQFDMQLTF